MEEPARSQFLGKVAVGVAGPMTNLLLAVLASLIFHATGGNTGQEFANALIIFVQVNVAFFVFNMIPFPPLDGSRLLYAFAPEPLQELMRVIESFGFMAILLFILILFQFASGPIIGIENAFITFLLG
jgi:Zn-dependent protease